MKAVSEGECKSVDVMELYSPARVTEQAQIFGLRPGEAMDLKTGWNFDREEDWRAAKTCLRDHKPLLLVESPMCTMFSQLQSMTPWTATKHK